MKKVINVMIVFVLLILVQNVAFADMGIPGIKGYTAEVIKLEGANWYSFDYTDDGVKEKVNGTIAYGTKIEVQYETEENGKTYILYEDENTNKMGYILIDDIKIISDNGAFQFDKENKKDAKVLSKDEIVLRKGAAYAYPETGVVIPEGTELVVYPEKGNYDSPWYYTEYNGTVGWICELGGVIGYKEDGSFRTYEDTNITDNKGNILGVLPANTEINDYYELDPWSQAYYITYDGITGEVYNRTVAYKPYSKSQIEVVKPGVKLYASYDESANSEYSEEDIGGLVNPLTDEIPVGTKLDVIYDTDYIEIKFVEYNGVKGWIEGCDAIEYIFPEEVTTENTEDITTEEVVNEVEEEEVVENKIENVVVATINTDEIKAQTGINLSPEEFVLFGVCVAVAIAFTSITTIILINKGSKKSKKEESPKAEETKKEE